MSISFAGNMTWGPARIWTAIAGFRVQSANRYATGPDIVLIKQSFDGKLLPKIHLPL